MIRSSMYRVITALMLNVAIFSTYGVDRFQMINFPPGKSSLAVHNQLIERDSHIYAFSARAGQLAEVSINALQNNANMTLYQPHSSLHRSDDGSITIKGVVLPGGDPVPGADPGTIRHWKGILPKTGTYYIEIVSGRGNVNYRLMTLIE